MTDDEKRELIERLKLWRDLLEEDCNWLGLDDEPFNKIIVLIAAPPPKHTMCENCLDDLELYNWVYCDKCWQGLCADADKLIVKNRELKQARPQVDEKFIEKYAEEIFSDIYRPLFPLYAILKRMLQEANVEIKEEK